MAVALSGSPSSISAPRSFAGLPLLASALVHAAAFVVLGPLASSGARAPVPQPAGPAVVVVALSPWPLETNPMPENALPAQPAPHQGSPAPRAVRAPGATGSTSPAIAVQEAPEGPSRPPVPAATDGIAALSVVAVPGSATVTSRPATAEATLLQATYLDTPEPEYPLSAREAEQEGVVILRVRISPDGLPTEIVVGRSSGYRSLDRAAVAGVRRWSFTPARRGAESIEAWMEVPIRFRLG